MADNRLDVSGPTTFAAAPAGPPPVTRRGRIRHPALRVAAWLWVGDEYRQRVSQVILEEAVPLLPFRPVRVEIVGSMARGCARLRSDLDLNLGARDWNEQVEWRRLWNDPCVRAPFGRALATLDEDLGLQIDAWPQNPDQFTYDITYDLLSGSLVDPLRAFPDPTPRWWDPWEFRWRTRDYEAKADGDFVDHWPAEEVARWRSVYGNRFLTR